MYGMLPFLLYNNIFMSQKQCTDFSLIFLFSLYILRCFIPLIQNQLVNYHKYICFSISTFGFIVQVLSVKIPTVGCVVQPIKLFTQATESPLSDGLEKFFKFTLSFQFIHF